MSNYARSILTTLTLLFASGCGGASATLDGYPAAQIDTPDRVRIASQASAAMIGGLYASIGQAPNTAAETCPVIRTEGNTTTVTGGCTDSQGTMYFGSYTSVHDTSADTYETRLNGFGRTSTRMCTPANGGAATMVTERSTADGVVRSGNRTALQGSFHVEVTASGDTAGSSDCLVTHVSTAVLYDGTWMVSGNDANMDGRPDGITWNGSGRFGRSDFGVVTASTTNEVVESTACREEALSGTTQIASGGHTVVITYDGSTDCSADHTVTWTYDGMSRGTLTGVSCTVAHGARGGRAVGMLGALLAGAAIVRRSRRRVPNR